MRLDQSWDTDAINSLVGRIYETILRPEQRGQTMDDIASACGGLGISVFSFTGYSLSNPPAAIHYASKAIAESVDFYARNVIMERNIACPRIGAINRQQLSDGVFNDASLIGENSLRGDPLIGHLAAEYKVGYAATRLTSALHNEAVFAISVLRGASAGMHEGSEMRLFDLLSGHLLRALQVFVKTATQPNTASLSLLERSDFGVIILDGTGRVQHANDTARAMEGDGFAIKNRQIVSTNRQMQDRLDRHLSAALLRGMPQEDSQPVALVRPLARKPLILQAVPLRPGDGLQNDWLLTNNGALVTLADPERPRGGIQASRFRLLGLTDAEARVATQLSTGASPEIAAETLGISIGTTRNHIKRIFSKLDISRQSQLVDLAGRLSVMTSGRH